MAGRSPRNSLYCLYVQSREPAPPFVSDTDIVPPVYHRPVVTWGCEAILRQAARLCVRSCQTGKFPAPPHPHGNAEVIDFRAVSARYLSRLSRIPTTPETRSDSSSSNWNSGAALQSNRPPQWMRSLSERKETRGMDRTIRKVLRVGRVPQPLHAVLVRYGAPRSTE